jgi:hypothetical protein
MTTATEHTLSAAQITGVHDPLLQELWHIKAQLNAQANYSIDALVQQLPLIPPALKPEASDPKLH